jgi:hypothetical protein
MIMNRIRKTGLVLAFGLTLVFAAAFLFAESARMPGVLTLGSISENYTAVTFDHPKHAALADGCASCHHHGEGDRASCKGCHNLGSSAFKNSVVTSFMPCSNCHAGNDRDNPSMPGLKVAYHKKCFECHRGMGNVGLDPTGCTELCHEKLTRTSGMLIRP